MGLMDLIDEACRFPSASARDLADKLLGGAVPGASRRFARAKRSTTAFTLSHYAGECRDRFCCIRFSPRCAPKGFCPAGSN